MFKGMRPKIRQIFVPNEENKYRPRILEGSFLFYCLITLLILKLIIVPFLIYFDKSVFFAAVTKSVLINLLNRDRQYLGLPPLEENPELNEAAFLKANDLLEKDYFSHQSPEGVSPWYWLKKAGYDYEIAGENLAIGFLDSEEVYSAWLDSPSHRANLLNPRYKNIGLAVAKGDYQGNETTVVVQFFGTPETSPKTLEKTEIVKEIQKAEKYETEQKEVLPTEFISQPQKSVFSSQNERVEGKITINLFSFFSSDYYKLLQGIIYGFLILVISALVLNVFVRFDIQHIDLILKAIGFIVLLILFIHLDKEVITALIPHNFNIY